MRTDPGDGAALLHAATRSGPKRGYYYQLLAMTGWTSLPFLGLVRQPTLVLGGDDDPIIPVANPRMQARLIPHARLHVYRGGHLGLITEADQLAPMIDSFLDENETHGYDDPRPRPTSGRHRRRPRRLGGTVADLTTRATTPRSRTSSASSCCWRSEDREPAQLGARVHEPRGRADHQRLLDPGGLPARAGARASPSSASPAWPTTAPAARAAAPWSTAWSPWSWPGSTPRSAPSWASTAAWRWARSSCAAPTSSGSAGCRRWRGWS